VYKINVSSHFSAAHQLRGYEGACRNVHGHTWKVRVGVLCETTDEMGMAMDFNVLKKVLHRLIDSLDHKFLNDLDMFQTLNPTSENVARYLYKQLREQINLPRARIADVEVWESDKSSVVYYEN
jgi:6-pyruvoyltetrahydropterin/6-carboxytetrahydropterin synthase